MPNARYKRWWSPEHVQSHSGRDWRGRRWAPAPAPSNHALAALAARTARRSHARREAAK